MPADAISQLQGHHANCICAIKTGKESITEHLSKIQREVDQVDYYSSGILLQLFFIISCNKPEQQAKHPQAVNSSQNSNRAGGEFNRE